MLRRCSRTTVRRCGQRGAASPTKVVVDCSRCGSVAIAPVRLTSAWRTNASTRPATSRSAASTAPAAALAAVRRTVRTTIDAAPSTACSPKSLADRCIHVNCSAAHRNVPLAFLLGSKRSMLPSGYWLPLGWRLLVIRKNVGAHMVYMYNLMISDYQCMRDRSMLSPLKMKHSFIENCCCITLQVSHNQERNICVKNGR